MKTAPKAFISHASEDKARFVVRFASKLREKGVDAWLDRWELLPGDSLIGKIFEEGIKNADAFLIILSSNSINKPWVREELDAGMIKKIEKTCRLIPVVIDECEMPATLKHLVWVRIRDLNDYENELMRIVNTIFGTIEKPPLGSAPKHAVKSVIDYLPNLTKIDNLVFASLGQRYLHENSHLLWSEPIYKELRAIDLTDSEINESLEILEGRGYIKLERVIGGDVEYEAVELYTASLDSFFRKEVPDYNQIIMTLASNIINENILTNEELIDKTHIQPSIVNHVLNLFELRGLVELAKTIGATHIVSVSAELKRMLR